MVIFFLILRATYFPIFLATKIWRILPPEYHQLYWKNKFLEIYNIKGETKIREIDPPKFTKFGGTISEKYQGNSGEYVIRWFHGKNCSNVYRGPQHFISNMLRRRHYKNSCYVFIYLGFTVWFRIYPNFIHFPILYILLTFAWKVPLGDVKLFTMLRCWNLVCMLKVKIYDFQTLRIHSDFLCFYVNQFFCLSF